MSDSWKWPGSRWWKFDFHAHTPASEDYGKGKDDQRRLRKITPKEWLLGFMRAGVDCVAVTDHNTGAWIDRLKAALQELEQEKPQGFREIHLFPGVELSVNGGFHLIALLDTDSSTSDIDTLLGLVEYDGDKGDSNGVTKKSAVEVVEAVLNAGGIPIPAHTDRPKGLLRLVGESSKAALDANTLRQIFDSEGILAMEVASRDSAKPGIYLERKLTWLEVLGSDSHHPPGGDGPKYPGSHFTWVKMAKPSLEGLRLALLDDGGFSIRRSDDPELFSPFDLPEHFIEEVQIEDAQYMGRNDEPAILNFNPWLNALVGGRGTGKSTVIHALRLAARRELKSGDPDMNGEAHATFTAFNQVPADHTKDGGLTNQTEIRLTVRRDGIPHRVLWRQDGTGTVVEEYSESEEDWKKSATQIVTSERFPLRIFSQGQIADLASENQQQLLKVIDEAAGVGALESKLDEASSAFYTTRARIRQIDISLERREGLTVELGDVERKLKRFEDEGYSAILTAYGHRTRQIKEMNRQFEVAGTAVQRIEDLAADLQPEDLPDGLFDYATDEDRQALESMTAIADAMRASARSLRDSANRLRETTKQRRETLAQSSWQTAVTQASADYKDLVTSLREEGVSDPNEYGQLVQERQRLESELAGIESEREERDRLIKQSQDQLKSVLESRRAVSDARTKYLSTALAQNGYVRIRIRPYGDVPRVVERSLREVLGILDDRFQNDILVADEDGSRGCVAQLLERLPSNYDKRRPEFETRLKNLKQRFTSACNGKGGFGVRFNNNLHNQFKQNPDFLDKLLTWFPKDGLTVEYSRHGNGKGFRPISQGSAGQRSAAMLAFLLAHGDEPLILDQPEDDLDNHLIYDLVVRQIRENKLRRQIIVVTHNPNIVVNGDAEMLHALDFQNNQCAVVQSGSLQDKEMREEICRVMEGGREAFDRRYRRLGQE